MKIFHSEKHFLKFYRARKKLVTVIGVFDGVHKAHKKVLSKASAIARKERQKTLVITFHPHPANVLGKRPRVPMLSSLEHRLRLLSREGIDYVLVINFTRKFSAMRGSEFIHFILGNIPISKIVVGDNFFFGKNRDSSAGDLKKEYKNRARIIPAVKYKNKPISSTWIRSLIIKGRLKEAEKLLGRRVSVLGTVVRGRRRGRAIGFPTANVNPHHEAVPPSGVYAVMVNLGKNAYKGVVNIGVRPTFYEPGQPEATIEVHIFDFKRSIYGRKIEIVFVKKIRDERKFRNADMLRRQILKDVGFAIKELAR